MEVDPEPLSPDEIQIEHDSNWKEAPKANRKRQQETTLRVEGQKEELKQTPRVEGMKSPEKTQSRKRKSILLDTQPMTQKRVRYNEEEEEGNKHDDNKDRAPKRKTRRVEPKQDEPDSDKLFIW